ncbi:MAG: hypothetical protein HYY01_05830 [Chloroflexi bacterium]|nr:hypothetical protein [Chloroflexota bacterium]
MVKSDSFTVTELGIDIVLAAIGTETREVNILNRPGTYKLFCRPHEIYGMTGTLTVGATRRVAPTCWPPRALASGAPAPGPLPPRAPHPPPALIRGEPPGPIRPGGALPGPLPPAPWPGS